MPDSMLPVSADISDSTNSILKELAIPASKQIGKALGNVFGLINTVTLPIKFFNEYAQRNYKIYAEKLNEIPEERIKEVEPEIAIPLMEKLSYTSNEDLAKAYTNLLANASNKDKVDLIHPGFISKLESLSPDEAKLLEFIRKDGKKDYIYFMYKAKCSKSTKFNNITIPLTGLEKEIDTSVRKMAVYLNNLVSLSIIKDNSGFAKGDDNSYKNLRSMYSNIEEEYKKDIENGKYPELDTLDVTKSFYSLTPLGELFIEACTDNIS